MYHTPNQPVRGFVDEMQQREGQGGVLSLSLAHGFPWGDVERVGTRMLAICDDNAHQASAVAEEFGRKLWGLREALAVEWPDIPAAISQVETFVPNGKPLVLADFADNAGGGAPSDSTFVLAEVLQRNVKEIALGVFWDPLLVKTCLDVGEGATLQARLGGKVGVMSGQPIDLTVTVRAIKHKMTQLMGKTTMLMGTGVLLEADGVYLVLSDIRTQTFHPSAFTDLGLDLSALKAVVVKSSQHFYAGFEAIASEIIYIKGPGAITPDYTIIPFSKRDDRYWPKVEDPFSSV
jgi:microcystin degradation protein MlrC